MTAVVIIVASAGLVWALVIRGWLRCHQGIHRPPRWARAAGC